MTSDKAFMAQSVIDGAIGEVLTGPGCQQFDDPVLTGRQIEVRAVPEATRVLEDELAAGQSFYIRGRLGESGERRGKLQRVDH